jgi:hypothetical protein
LIRPDARHAQSHDLTLGLDARHVASDSRHAARNRIRSPLSNSRRGPLLVR